MKWNLFLIGGVFGLLIAGILFAKSFYIVQSGTKADALVTDVVYIKQSSSKTAAGSEGYYPVLEFNDSYGNRIKIARTDVLISPSPWKKGDVLPILYLKNNPNDYVNNSFVSLYLAPIIVSTISILVLFFGFFAHRISKKTMLYLVCGALGLVMIPLIYFGIHHFPTKNSSENLSLSYTYMPEMGETELLTMVFLILAVVAISILAFIGFGLFWVYKLFKNR